MHDSHEDTFDELLRDGPRSGIMFDFETRLYEAYNSFAKKQGFVMMCRSNISTYIVMSCDRAGKLDCKKHTKKTGCWAHINAIKHDSGEWKATTVKLGHNHDLDPNITALMASHRSLFMRMKRQLEAKDMVGIWVCKNIKLVEVQSGGPENLGATPRDCRNFINERRRLRLGDGDANAVHKLFSSLQKRIRDFSI